MTTVLELTPTRSLEEAVAQGWICYEAAPHERLLPPLVKSFVDDCRERRSPYVRVALNRTWNRALIQLTWPSQHRPSHEARQRMAEIVYAENLAKAPAEACSHGTFLPACSLDRAAEVLAELLALAFPNDGGQR